MRKTLLAAIIAATALVPPAALAQDRGGRGNRNGGEARSQSSEPRQSRGEWRQRSQAAPQAQAPQAQAPQARPQRQWNGGQQGQQGQPRREWNGERRQQQAIQAQAQRLAPVQQTQQRQRDGDRGNRGGRWNNGQNQNQQQYRGNRDRNNNGGWNNNNRNNGNRWNNNGGWSNNDRNGSRWNNGWRNNNRYDWRGYRSGNRSHYRLPRYYAPSGYGYGYQRYGIGFTLNSILFGQQYWINDPYSYRLPDVYGPYRWVRYYNDALLVDVYSGEVVDTVYDIFW